MRTPLLFLLLSLPALAKPCMVEGFKSVKVPEDFNCVVMEAALEAARIQASHITNRRGEGLRRELSSVRVVLVPTKTFDCGGTGAVLGCWEPELRRIRVAHTPGPLLHELLHVLEPRTNATHAGWDKRGWTYRGLVFARLWGAFDGPPD
jgi:hypothetical protein